MYEIPSFGKYFDLLKKADWIYIRKYFITSPLNKSKEMLIRNENLFILHDLIKFYKPYDT